MKYLVFILTMVMVACQPSVNEKVYLIEGEAQGSTYHIKYIAERDENLKPAIDSILEVIDRSMSTYRSDSAISKINQGDTTVVVDEHFRKVFEASQQIWQESEGLFDPTVGVLVNAWGFGKQKISEADLPTDKKIDSLRKYVGFDKVAITEKNLIKKRYTEILFDFNAIAQGYTSDVVANYLSARGIKNYIVEIAGEMYLKGKNTVEDKSWTIGVENPLKPLDDRDLVATIQFTNQGLATSGNYRKVWTDSNGRKYVHSINPLTGRATQSDVLSATVVAPSTMLADGYATMFMVMGLAKSKAFLEKHPDLAVLLVYSDDKHQEATYKTKSFEKLIIH
ncbi:MULTISPECIES: FAD:protein FMN transferase [Capnocytophaga]|uniref:FAD:protein FMN transferase n=1 Tax=Capnocytophaga TaxID=1016 RepID=UPI00020C77C5|nr:MULTISPECIES: FAD:protein FMN transferase [Capnocytophaga]KHE69195.1 ApbE family protein [Capnocytophaga sp. oral taxon 329 str. F0087]MBB1547116.1 FAD:protein FMN transferase [Capnocytophaga sp.]MBB1568425.1 FAD:protein FMN transferase [Capnocytophaga sp.]QGS18157.1 FAD:protein FMN transferase [Capnocytophaga sp. FDAARGOS_737]